MAVIIEGLALMPYADRITLAPLIPDDFEELAAFWRTASPLHPVSPAMLHERLFALPAGDPDLLLAARGTGGKLLGFAAGVCIPEHLRFAGVRWLALAPELNPAGEGRGVAGPLLEELCRRLKARGVEKVRLLGTPPYYFRPGIDTRETGLIACLLDLGWKHEGTFFNMTVDLATWASPGAEAIFAPDARGYRVRRARGEDREAFIQYMEAAWNASWRDESLQAFAHDPMTLFLAVKAEPAGADQETIVGFAAYEVSQCLGGFGPTGITPEHRGAALGRRVLWACLHDLKEAGRVACEIGWVGPVNFYHRACGAALGPAYYFMTQAL